MQTYEQTGRAKSELTCPSSSIPAIQTQDDEVVMELKQSRQEICHLSEELQALKVRVRWQWWACLGNNMWNKK